MSLSVLFLIIGLTYIVLMGVLSLFRREGLSIRFAIEALVIIFLAIGLFVFANISVHPILFLLVLYLVTMRVRLLVDIATAFARRGRLPLAERIFAITMHLWPDRAGLFILQVNRATAFLQAGKLEEAIQMFNEVLSKSSQGSLGVKYESAAHYNLGVAYLRQNKEALAVKEFNIVLDTWPVSESARHAASALERHRNKSSPAHDK